MPDPTPNPTPIPAPNPGQDLSKEIETLKARNAELDKKILELTKTPEPEDKSLQEKARIERDAKDKKRNDTKALESALTFNLKAEDWLKTNESLLPKEVGEIFKLAQKESYNDPIEKDGAIKASIIQSFFSVQANMDLLTGHQKTSLDEYLKLTKTGKQDKAQGIYSDIFEPSFEMLRRIKKAEALSKGHSDTNEDDFQVRYKNKLVKLAREVHLGEKTK